VATGQRLDRQTAPVDLEYINRQVVQVEVQCRDTGGRSLGCVVKTHGVSFHKSTMAPELMPSTVAFHPVP
jgi:hypothetical protein